MLRKKVTFTLSLTTFTKLTDMKLNSPSFLNEISVKSTITFPLTKVSYFNSKTKYAFTKKTKFDIEINILSKLCTFFWEYLKNY